MNAAIRAVVRAGAYHGVEVFGICRGYEGLIDGEIRPLGPRDVSGVINEGGTILRTARCRAFFEPDGRAAAARQLERHGIGGVVVIGGDGSYRGATALHAEHGTRCIGLPGTIDNDIGGTDFTIGFDTAFNTAIDAIDRIRDTAQSHERIFYIEVMGRESGYLAMASGVAGGAEEILVPESPTQLESVVERLRKNRDKGKKSAIIVVAEGDEAGNAITVAQRIAEASEFKDYRVVVIGHLQRGGRPSAFDRLLASRMGVRAVEALLEGEAGKMVGIRANEIVLAPLSHAWEQRSSFDPRLAREARILAT
jgi:6-phosphofructokinase 1